MGEGADRHELACEVVPDWSRAERPAEQAPSASELEERLRILTAFASGIVFEFDVHGRYLRVWAGEPSLLARPVDELLGRTITDVIGPDPGDRFLALFRHVIDTDTPATLEYSLDVQAGRRAFSCQARPHERDGGDRTVTLLVRDVTEQRELQAKIMLSERLAALGMIAAGVGHEIRQPLAFVLNSIEVLTRSVGPTANAEVRESLERVETGARRIASIVESLDLLRPNGARQTKLIDARRPVEAALDLCGNALEGRARLYRRLPDVPLVVGNDGELCQVFLNLVLNAAQAIPPGAPDQNSVTVETSARDGFVRISVRDTGAGISPDVRARMFEPFFTTKSAGEGTGLGLYISARLVESHGGKLEIDSTPGKGTTVHVLLPVAERDPIPEATTSIRRRSRKRLSVLVIDDEPRVLESLRLVLDGVHDVTIADRAAVALEMVEKDPKRFDVILCDLTMADLDGVAFYDEVERLGIADRFAVMTGGAFTDRAEAFIARRVCPTIDKPFMFDELLAALDKVGANHKNETP